MASPAVGTFVVLARHGVMLDDRTLESGGNVGVSAGTGSPANTLTVGADAHVAIGKALIAPHAAIGARTVVGEVDATQIDVGAGASIAKRGPFVAPPSAPVPGTFAAGTTPVSVPVGATLPVTAGAYGAVNVSGTLNLAGGTYTFASLRIDNGARVVALAPAVVKTAGGILALDRAQLVPQSARAGDLRLEVTGTVDALGNGMKFGTDAHVTALTVVQRKFSAGDRLVFAGALAAEDVYAGHDSKLAFDGGFTCAAASDCTSGANCVAGACTDGSALACQTTNVTRLPVDAGTPFDLASDGTRLYWTNVGGEAIQSAALDGSSPATLVNALPGLSGIAVDSNFVYFTNLATKSISRVAKAGGVPEVVAAAQRAPRFVESTDNQLVWTNEGSGNTDGSIRRYDKTTGAIEALADGLPGPWTLAVSNGRVYWSDVNAGTVSSRASTSEPIQTAASGLVTPALAFGSSGAGFLSGDGRLFDFNATQVSTEPRAASAPGAFSVAMLGTAAYVTNGNQQSVSEQSSPTAYPATIWRRSGTATPRVIRSLGGKLWFTAQGSSPPGSVFDFAPSAAIAIPAGSPACAAGRSNATCDLTASAITPLLECVVETSDHRLIAHFGYKNADSGPRRLGVGPENRFDRANTDACQPTNFAAGTHHDVFAVGFVEELTWIVGARSATAGRSSPRCAVGSVANTEVSP